MDTPDEIALKARADMARKVKKEVHRRRVDLFKYWWWRGAILAASVSATMFFYRQSHNDGNGDGQFVFWCLFIATFGLTFGYVMVFLDCLGSWLESYFSPARVLPRAWKKGTQDK